MGSLTLGRQGKRDRPWSQFEESLAGQGSQAFLLWRERRLLALIGRGTLALVAWGVATSSAGSRLWWIALVVAFLAALGVGRPRLPAALLLLAGMFFGTTHVAPTGPGLLCSGGSASGSLHAHGGKGTLVVHTGFRCIASAGHLSSENCSAQASMMVNNSVWPALQRAYEEA